MAAFQGFFKIADPALPVAPIIAIFMYHNILSWRVVSVFMIHLLKVDRQFKQV
ncbi:hypothetical protein AAULR_15353 [Lacticaseibacillus rhamnosus MTCC 5462]|nr:hypothetical protein AAULR_15353 [Lacticaseibacillus rhamnosus MTCC 5462]